MGITSLDSQETTLSPTTSWGGSSISQQAPNTLLLGYGTGISYDSNALNSQPALSNVQYMIYPQIGLSFARPRWNALISVVPGLSYSSANLPQYQGISVASGVVVQYQASPRLSLSFVNSLTSNTNPFDSLAATAGKGGDGNLGVASAPLDYLPKTNEYASAAAAYNLDARTSASVSASYNYLGYQHDFSIPAISQPFQQSNAEEVSLGLRRSFSSLSTGGLQYAAQLLDAGQGQIKTTGQSLQYTLLLMPRSSIRITAMIGPEYAQSTYTTIGDGITHDRFIHLASGWSWIGAATVNWTKGKSQLSLGASQLLSLGNQYQGNVRQDLLSASLGRQLTRSLNVNFFGAYSANKPVFVLQAASRFANNYLSTGTTVGKTLGGRWLLKLTYWYLLQNTPSGVVQPYSGNHNRVAVSLSYSLSKSLTR